MGFLGDGSGEEATLLLAAGKFANLAGLEVDEIEGFEKAEERRIELEA